jgi:two-component sensor histidine kinase
LDAVGRIRAGVAEGKTVNEELLNYRKDGTTFWNELHLSPVRDRDGRLIYYFGSQWDVSERRNAQALRAAEHRLLREVDHRALNALTLVQGFVRLSRRDSVERFAQAVQGRVEVLARTHTMLARARWADVTLEQVLQSELSRRAPDRVVLDGPRVLVSAQRVQAFALLIHELASNAVLHGALANPKGRLDVSWRAGGAPGVVDLAWRERGLASADRGHAGFGERLMLSIARRQLLGRLTQTWDQEGMITKVTCHLAATADSLPSPSGSS